jgi:hypothetical protein
LAQVIQCEAAEKAVYTAAPSHLAVGAALESQFAAGKQFDGFTALLKVSQTPAATAYLA